MFIFSIDAANKPQVLIYQIFRVQFQHCKNREVMLRNSTRQKMENSLDLTKENDFTGMSMKVTPKEKILTHKISNGKKNIKLNQKV